MKPMVNEKAEGMLRRLRKWGMTCLFSHQAFDSDSESEDEKISLPDLEMVEPVEGVKLCITCVLSSYCELNIYKFCRR